MATNELETTKHIATLVQEGLPKLAPHLKEWGEEHLVSPRQISLSLEPEGHSTQSFWLVTDHTGQRDSAYRVVYDKTTDSFGLEMQTTTGIHWYIGSCGGFAQTIENM